MSEKLFDETGTKNVNPVVPRQSYKNVAEIVTDTNYSTWVKLQDSSASLALHFMYKDTLALSYSPECWLHYPYKIEDEIITVYWANCIDTKYGFDIVQAINNTDNKYLGKPFMYLELVNDTTLKATYPIPELIRKINNSSKERTFFPDTFTLIDFYL